MLVFKKDFSLLAEEESEPEEEDKSRDQPRDSGCFDSSEILENGREEANKEEVLEEQVEEGQQQEEEEEEQHQQLDAVQEQLEELTLGEGS